MSDKALNKEINRIAKRYDMDGKPHLRDYLDEAIKGKLPENFDEKMEGFNKQEDCPIAMMINNMNRGRHKKITCGLRRKCHRHDKTKHLECGSRS